MNGIVPIWVSAPLAMLSLVVIAAHLIAMRSADMPESRKRIRTANGWLMLVTVPVLAIAFSLVSSANPRQFALVWAIAILLLGLVLVMAFVDIGNNLRLAREKQKRLHRTLGSQLRSELAARSKDADA
ncbi:MAG: hypothetical protein HRU13_07025 [Phycisphaerales bacterium]|nr:hypothetical protein [Phycisphaerales bacterium]